MPSVRFSVPGRPVRWQRPGQYVDRRTHQIRRISEPAQEEAKRIVAHHARQAWPGYPTTGPVILRVVGIFEIPSSWPKALIAEAQAAKVMHIADPDLDQLVKLVQDALVGIVYVDDNQVCGYPNSAKRYGGPERTEITIETLDQTEAQKTPGQRRMEKRIAELGWDRFLFERQQPRNQSKTKAFRR
jgi:Holliday junction resolvase RusA-like endonuclease